METPRRRQDPVLPGKRPGQLYGGFNGFRAAVRKSNRFHSRRHYVQEGRRQLPRGTQGGGLCEAGFHGVLDVHHRLPDVRVVVTERQSTVGGDKVEVFFPVDVVQRQAFTPDKLLVHSKL